MVSISPLILSSLVISSLTGSGSEAFTLLSPSPTITSLKQVKAKVNTIQAASVSIAAHTNTRNRSYFSALYAESESRSETETSAAPPTPALYHHHVAIRTRNIENAITFYSLFGYEVEHKFRAGPARAAWLTNAMVPDDDNDDNDMKKKGQSTNVASRLEVIEVPSYILNEKENTIQRAMDLLKQEAVLGLNHHALDVTPYIHYIKQSRNITDYYGLDQFLIQIETESKKKFGKALRVAMQPRQQVIGTQVFELCFIYDADGAIVELVRYIKDLDQDISSGWEEWDGTGFSFVGVGEDADADADADADDASSADNDGDDDSNSTSDLLKDEITKDVSENTVVIYSKTRCPFCARTKNLFETEFQTVTPKIIELDTMENGSDIQDTLKDMTGQRTVPSVWVNGSFVGGNDDTQRLFASGDLKKMFG